MAVAASSRMSCCNGARLSLAQHHLRATAARHSTGSRGPRSRPHAQPRDTSVMLPWMPARGIGQKPLHAGRSPVSSASHPPRCSCTEKPRQLDFPRVQRRGCSRGALPVRPGGPHIAHKNRRHIYAQALQLATPGLGTTVPSWGSSHLHRYSACLRTPAPFFPVSTPAYKTRLQSRQLYTGTFGSAQVPPSHSEDISCREKTLLLHTLDMLPCLFATILPEQL